MALCMTPRGAEQLLPLNRGRAMRLTEALRLSTHCQALICIRGADAPNAPPLVTVQLPTPCPDLATKDRPYWQPLLYSFKTMASPILVVYRSLVARSRAASRSPALNALESSCRQDKFRYNADIVASLISAGAEKTPHNRNIQGC